MLGTGKKGGIAALIIGELKKKKGGDGMGEKGSGFGMGGGMGSEEEDGGGEEEAAMGEFMDALKSGDKAAALETFKALVDACE